VANGEEYVDSWPKTGLFVDDEKKAIWAKFITMKEKIKNIDRLEIQKAWGATPTDVKYYEKLPEPPEPLIVVAKTSIMGLIKKFRIKWV
jgi:hypothetical protein